MKKRENELEITVRKALKGKNVPILILDQRWHKLFPQMDKPPEVFALEDKLNTLLKRQGFLVNDIKDLKKTKNKLMDGIVSSMSEETEITDKKKKNQQRLMLEINERIQDESDELMDLPRKIKAVNEDLLVIGVEYSFDRLENGDKEVQQLEKEIKEMRKELSEREQLKSDLQDSMDSAYALMHGLLGHDIMNIYDRKKKG